METHRAELEEIHILIRLLRQKVVAVLQRRLDVELMGNL